MKRFRSAITGKWVSRLFARNHPATTVSETTVSETVVGTRVDAIFVWPRPTTTTGSPPKPQCQYCGYAVAWDALECPSCHAIFDEGEGGVPA